MIPPEEILDDVRKECAESYVEALATIQVGT